MYWKKQISQAMCRLSGCIKNTDLKLLLHMQNLNNDAEKTNGNRMVSECRMWQSSCTLSYYTGTVLTFKTICKAAL